jgi:hypothetical protein
VEVFSADSYVSVTKYTLQRSLDGKKFIPVKANQEIEVFQGNHDRTTDVENELTYPATARYIRVIPLQCNGACAGNFEILGGPVETCQVLDNVALTGDQIVGYDQDGKTNQAWADLTYRVTAGDSDGIFCFPEPSIPTIHVCDPEGLDFEKAGQITLTVTVFDAGEPALSNTGTVKVTVLDLNEAPALEPTIVNIHENAKAKTKVNAPIVGTDPDDGDVLTYTLTADDSFGKLSLNLKTGIIFVTELGAQTDALNYEVEPMYNFTVRVSDQNGLWSENAVSVRLIDINEPPTMDDISLSVNENPDPLSAVGTPISAYDVDEGPNGVIGYSIDSQEVCHGQKCETLVNELFGIDRLSGQILVTRSRNANGSPSIDYEAGQENGTTTHRLVIRATDMGWLFDTATVLINTADVNEAPYFHDLASETSKAAKYLKLSSTMLHTTDDGLTRRIRGGVITENTEVVHLWGQL